MSSRFIDWLTSLTAKTTTIDGSEITHIGSSGLSQKATLSDVIRYGGGTTRNVTSGNATMITNTSGALWLEVAGQTAGNARGAGSFDWQATRSNAARVASGVNAVCLGWECTASASTAIALGVSCQALGAASVAIGEANVANSQNAVALGKATRTDSTGQVAVGFSPAAGQAQANVQTFYTTTADASATVLNITNNAAGRMLIPAMRACGITGLVTAMSDATDGYKVKAWEIKCVITRDNSNNTRIVGTPVIVELGADTEAATWAITSITADNTNESLAITVTGEAATNIRWQASLFYGQVGY